MAKQFILAETCTRIKPRIAPLIGHKFSLPRSFLTVILPHIMPEKTLFEKIIDREIPATIEHEDDVCVAIRDIEPQAPVHLLIIPKKRITRIGETATEHRLTLGHLMTIAGQLGNQLGPEGFRLVINNGAEGGEAVPHLHVHLLAGRQMGWPPG